MAPICIGFYDLVGACFICFFMGLLIGLIIGLILPTDDTEAKPKTPKRKENNPYDEYKSDV